MANQDSFIDEVNEEVRRDRLYGYLRRYGWIGLTIVVLIVAGAAYNEYRKSRDRAAAEAFGDSILIALEESGSLGRAAALSEIETAPGSAQEAILTLLQSAIGTEADLEARLDALDALSANSDLPQSYRELAALKAGMLGSGSLPAQERIDRLQALALPGKPYALLASEQIALAHIEMGNEDLAIELLQNVIADNAASEALRRRASQVIVALGGTVTTP